MSHLKNPPVQNSVYLTSFVLVLTLVSGSGCTMLQIPSYRLEDCGIEESYSNSPALLPPLPMPGWLARWKAEKDLPKPPASPRFHPLPTRPMFQPQATPGFNGPASNEGECFGKLPPAEAWNAMESVTPIQTPTSVIGGRPY